jgi:RHS repeat-associated protein
LRWQASNSLDANYTQQWDKENRLTSVTGSGTATFVYDEDGNRVKATLNGVTTAYIGNYYEQTGSAIKKYYYAGGTRIAVNDNGTLYWLLGDHLGSTSIAANGTTGAWYAEQRYKPWGEQRYPSGASTLPTRHRFTGQVEDSEIGLYFYGARYYSSYLNRWLSPDTIVPDLANPQSLNRFSYVLNNPLRYTDPTGHRECDDGPSSCLPLTPVNPFANPYGIRFTADKGLSWSAAQVNAVLGAAGAIGRRVASLLREENRLAYKSGDAPLQHFSPVSAFNLLFKMGITFLKSKTEGYNLFTNPAYGGYVVESYASNIVTMASAAHEMGHAFAQQSGGLPYTVLASAAGEITYPNGDHLAGGGGIRSFDGMDYSMLQDRAKVSGNGVDPTHEDFADMFAHWTFGWFTHDELGAGQARQTWMDVHMAEWIR